MPAEDIFANQNLALMNKPATRGIDLNLIIAFGINQDIFAVKLTDCKEVVEEYQITPIPVCNPLFKGIVNLRGTLVPVVNTELMYDRDTANYSFTEHPKILVLEDGDTLLGIEVGFARKEFITAEIEEFIGNGKDTSMLTIADLPVKFITANWLRKKLEA